MNSAISGKVQPRRIHWLWHGLIWLLYACFWVFGFNTEVTIHIIMGQVIFTVYNAGLVYINAYYLIPKFLNVGRVGVYLLAIAGALIFATLGLSYSMYFYLEFICQCDGAFFKNVFASLGPTLGSNVTVLFVSMPIHLYRQRRALQRYQEEQEKNHLQTELKLLKDQLNPHFLFNALNNIYFLIKKDPDLASDALVNLSDLLRYQLYETEGPSISLEKEIQNIRQFCKLASLRKSDEFKLETNLNAHWNGHTIEPLLLLPLVENAFKYTDHSDGFITINATIDEDSFTFEVINSLPSTSHSSEKGGIGLSNLQRRLDLLYPDHHQFKIDKDDSQYVVRLNLQM